MVSNAFFRSINTQTVGIPWSIVLRHLSVDLVSIDPVDLFFLIPA